MGPISRSVATLRIAGENLIPEEVSALLGQQPTRAQRKGDVISLGSGKTRTANFGHWRLEASNTEPQDVDGQVAELLGKLSQDLQVWQALTKRFRVDMFFGWFMKSTNEGVSISPASLRLLGERGIELALDIYSPEESA